MSADQTELGELLAFAVSLARDAGEITLKYFQRSPKTETKVDGSFVTVADREAEAYLRRTISDRFPNDGILGEEAGEHQGSSGRRWIVDPIDGTFSFVHGVPLYGVLIALEIDGEPLIGVINIPALNEIVYAAHALAPIIEEAGGTFTDCQGIRTINGGNAISTNGALFKEVIRIVNNEKD